MDTAPEERIEDFRLDRTQFSVGHLTDADDAIEYWLSRPVEERLRALGLLRRTFYGYTDSNSVELDVWRNADNATRIDRALRQFGFRRGGVTPDLFLRYRGRQSCHVKMEVEQLNWSTTHQWRS